MSSHTTPVYQPISFVSPISDTVHRRHSDGHSSPLRRLLTYLKNSVTLEDIHQATRRESIISDHMGTQAESMRRASVTSTKDREDDIALQTWRRQSVDAFWGKYGEVGEGGVRRSSLVGNAEGEVARRNSVGRSTLGRSSGRWRRMSWRKEE